MSEEITIQPTPPERQRDALELLFSGMPTSERVAQIATTLAALKAKKLSLSGLLEARKGDALAGVVWGSVLGGRVALVWPPQLATGESESTAIGLFTAIDDWMRTSDVQLANAFLVDDRSQDAQRLKTAGFTQAAQILYLVSEKASFPDSPISTELEFEPFSEAKQGRLAEIVERTYEGTLDCPSMDGKRDIDDVLAGYRQSGAYDPARWFLVRQKEKDIGCLLLTDHPAEDQWELIYQGIVPEARGHGFGLVMTRHAQWLTADANRSRLVLAVDAENKPAISAYAEAGFHQWDRRYVYVKLIS